MRQLLLSSVLALAAPAVASAHTWYAYSYGDMECIDAPVSPDVFIQYVQGKTGETVTVDRDPDNNGRTDHVQLTYPNTDPGQEGMVHVFDFFTSMSACHVFQRAQSAGDQNADLN